MGTSLTLGFDPLSQVGGVGTSQTRGFSPLCVALAHASSPVEDSPNSRNSLVWGIQASLVFHYSFSVTRAAVD